MTLESISLHCYVRWCRSTTWRFVRSASSGRTPPEIWLKIRLGLLFQLLFWFTLNKKAECEGGLMDEHEVYPNAPVVLVAFELRHPTTESLSPSETRAVKERLVRYTPIARNAQNTQIQLPLLPSGSTPASARVENFPRLVSRDSTLAISLRREALVVETSAYPGWDAFKEIVSEAIGARMAISALDGVERVGLRYIDEVRIPGVTAPDWTDWIDSSLLGPRPKEQVDLSLSEWQGVSLFGSQPGRAMLLRYGTATGFAVDPQSELRRTNKAQGGGPFFLFDIDSFWTPESSVPEIELTALEELCVELHRPVRRLFEGLIKDRLREEVFRNGQGAYV